MGRIAIIGLGLIGGSLGLALKRHPTAQVEIAGYDRDHGVANRAKRAGAVDIVARSPAAAVEGAALVIVATPISAARDVFAGIAPALPEGCVVTDTCSTKAGVMRWAAALLPGVEFVGGHPMAGKESGGIDAADAGLFQDAAYCIVPGKDTDAAAIEAVAAVARAAGAFPIFLDADEHDGLVAAVSHLPLVVSTALFSLLRASRAWPELSALAGGGFRDLTRLASGSAAMSRDICLTNRDQVLHWIDRFTAELQRFRRLVEEGGDELLEAFAEANAGRALFLKKPRGEGMPLSVPPDVHVPSSSERLASLLVPEALMEKMREVTKATEEREAKERGKSG